ncbi:MAG: NAD(P)-dependent oxidoreductase [Candidatus Eremiobacteraeota bacterium]|nr:NAD(P)-dependent oxidoreductase [Candidatus Eremiobacteraeota bacterium]MBV8583181.1 NAD(P)-dependent oxidoreductase [Candidatus Eremiobacteraeota bacterium]MBV8655504.1 NAD(P)-dependent oxidoreductase [Candidatus Eremiobacteraeota bacterium]
MTIAYFGTGLLGSQFVRAMLERGEDVRVWNRTAAKARALAADGASVCENAVDAVRGAAEVHLTLADDASVDAVLEPLAAAIGAETIVADHTTTAPTPTRERARRWHERGVTFVHAPVFMGPKNAREASGIMLLSGDPVVRARVKPSLERMTGQVVELGDDPAMAAAFKLMGNLMLVFTVAGLADMYRFAEGLGIPPHDAHELFSFFMPVNAINFRGKDMAHGNFTPQWELAMARKDVRLMLEEAARHGETLAVLPEIAALFDRYIERGHAAKDVGVVALNT